jgi:molecular chaperone DnaK
MARATIDFGIDLGTTNSEIAVLEGTTTNVFKNNEGQEFTPSAVWIDRKDRMYVGRPAKEQIENDSENAHYEFKLQMGTSHIYHFVRSGRQMRPEELSAEVLKSLLGDVQQSTGEQVLAAAISVPAAFELPQCDATNRAAKLSGLSFSPLVQEPVAAALTYGFQSQSDRVFWMVYDFGGGTFDVAIIQVRDGQIQVIHHNGDNHLGGKLIDWEIVEQLFIPAITSEYTLSDFKRGNTKWKAAFAKLKLYAEQAKIRLSREESTDIIIDPLCQDDKGIGIRFEYEIKRSDIIPLIEPFVERSVNLCKKTLEEKRLSTGHIEKIILVGGPTLTPVFRDLLKDKLEIPLESSIDPLTVIARGAAIFAGTQSMPKDIIQQKIPDNTNQYSIELEYEPIGAETEPFIGGKITAPEEKSLEGYTIEFVEEKTQWRSGKISINTEGNFTTSVHASEHTSKFLIKLEDGTGNICQTVPDHFSYTLGMVITGQPLINSVGVGLANEQMQIFLQKGTPLPARRREIHRTTVPLRKGESGTFLRIPVLEGENTRHANRNSKIGALEISGEGIRRDVPIGSDVEITIDIDESRLIRTKAYIPVLDEEYENILELAKETADINQLDEDFSLEKERLERVRDQARQVANPEVDGSLKRVEDEEMLHDVEVSLAAAQADSDATDKCEKRLRDLKSAIDEAEDVLELPILISQAEQQIEGTREIVDQYGKEDDQKNFDSIERELKAAIAAKDEDLIRQRVEHLEGLRIQILMDQPGFWIGYFEFLEGQKSDMRDQTLAERLIVQGYQAIDTNDLNELKTVVRQLNDLMSSPISPDDPRIGQTMPKFH